MNRFKWALNTALRDARGSRTKALLYAGTMALGIAALVGMTSLGLDLRMAVHDQARTLLGADLTFQSRQPLGPKSEEIAAKIPGQRGELLRFATMAYFPKSDTAVFSRVRAASDNFPFYGELITDPATAAKTFTQGNYALIDPSLGERAGVGVGDTVKVGDLSLEIAGFIIEAPGESSSSNMFGPRVYIPRDKVDASNLIRRGSRVFYTTAFKTADGVDPDALALDFEETLQEERVTWDTVKTVRRDLGESMAQLTGFLALAACLALLLGGIGVAGGVHYHLRQKRKQVAVMRCIGATWKQVTSVYLIQIAGMALIALPIGALLGIAFQFSVPAILKGLLPIDFQPRIHAGAVLTATAWGLVMSFWLATAPLAALRRIGPLATFRGGGLRFSTDWVQTGVYGSTALLWWLFAYWQTEKVSVAGLYLAGLLGCIGLLWGTGKLLEGFAKKIVSIGLPFTWRQGLSSLFRPGNQTSLMTIILGMGIFLLVLLSGSQSMLLNQFNGALSEDRPNFLAFDIQNDQVQGVVDIFEKQNLPILNRDPLVPMRILSIKGVPIGQLMDSDIPSWMLQREYRSTYRDHLNKTETLTAGRFVERIDPNQQPIPVTVENELAETLQIGLGDQVEMDVLGLPMTLEIVGLRNVDWQSMQPNFYFVFPIGPLDEAPQMTMITSRTEGAAQVAAIQRELVKTYPNVTAADMTEIVNRIEKILTKAATAVRFLALLCMGTGLLLLIVFLWNSRYERLGEHALLRTLGARKPQIIRVVLSEYFLLGLFAAASGILLASVGCWALGRFLFKVDAFPDPSTFGLPLLILPLITAFMGYWGHRDLLGKHTAFQILREETA